MNSNILVDKIVSYLEDKKAIDIKIIDISDVTIVAEYFIICSGTSAPHIKALVDEVEQKLKVENIEKLRLEGYETANWVLLDYGDIVVHVFKQDEREFYNLERLWADERVKVKQ